MDQPSADEMIRLTNSLPVQLGISVLVVVSLAFAVALYIVSRQDERNFFERYDREVHRIATVISSHLVQPMLAGGGATVWEGISAESTQIGEVTGALRILVLSSDGLVKAGSDPVIVGTRIEVKANPDCPGCDSTRAEDFPKTGTVATPGGGRRLRVVNAIPNLPRCHACHEATKPIRGYLSVDFDLDSLERSVKDRRTSMVMVGLGACLVLMTLVALLFRRFAMRSINALILGVQRLASGDLAARVRVFGRNELSLLARRFNRMAQLLEDQVARIEAAHTESELLYTLVVEASKNMETSEVAAGVARVLLQKLRPKHAAFFLETADGGWTCASGGTVGDESVTSGEGALEEVLGGHARQLRLQLADMPAQIVADACRTRKLKLTRDAGGLTFALPVVAETRLVGLLIGIGIPANIQVGEDMLENIGVHLTLAAINSRNYNGAITDGLTRLKNKRYGLVRLEEAVYVAKRYKSGLGLLVCDIDHFKRVNDTYGHPAGDTVLKEVSRRIAACVRKADVVLRYGGEEFMLILPETDAHPLAAIGEKVRQAVSATPVDLGTNGVLLPLTISVGVAAFHADSDSGETLIARADAALYRAKEGGRDRVEFDS